ncbi:MaoC family dehydratase [Bradyrhizobium sp. A11]|uniref:MaoC family dehydratase n=1 Tax=Bradyrhizobium sp. A11 TaxID=3133974 RepID=UPI003245417B
MKPFRGAEHRQISFSELSSLVGQELGCSEWVEITQADVDKFADATGDHEWIHVDVPRATKAFGAPVAHGYLTLALLPMLSQSMIETIGMRNGLNYGLDRCRFTNIVHVGQRVRLRQMIVDVTPRGDGFLVVKDVSIEIENEKRPALVAEVLFLLFPESDGDVPAEVISK